MGFVFSISQFEPLGTCDLKWLTLKTVFLTLLASGKRREVHAWTSPSFSTMRSGIILHLLLMTVLSSRLVLEIWCFYSNSFIIPALDVTNIGPTLLPAGKAYPLPDGC
jgi:hypothetical protein